MMITVAICTWNRSARLAKCLEQIMRCEPPRRATWELVVVNNNSTDDTDAVLASYSSKLPLRRVWQPIPGVSNARNSAVAEGRGDYFIWTDDDVRVAPDWIVEYEKAFEAHPEAALFGGPIGPHFEEPPPQWLLKCLPVFATAYALRDFGTEPVDLTESKLPFGANWAIRSDVQRAMTYDTRLGRHPADMARGGEEIKVMADVLAQGHAGRWVPSARVGHLVPPERQTLAYVKRYYRGIGRTMAITDPWPGRMLVGYRSPWLIREAAQMWWAYRILKWTRDESEWAPMLMHASITMGRALARGVPRRPQR